MARVARIHTVICSQTSSASDHLMSDDEMILHLGMALRLELKNSRP
jgi:hypothetical protein